MKVSLVVPVYNEEDTVPIFYNAVRQFAPLKSIDVEIVFVNDGSQDGTLNIIKALALADPLVTLISLSRNFGKEAALFAGLETASGEAMIPIDVDLQDPIEIIPVMIEKWRNGADIVLAKRVDRSSDGRLKRNTAEIFYRLHNMISTPKIEANVGDFRLLSRPTVENIKQLQERNLFMKGILSWVGGTVDIVEYRRSPRSAGNTKFNGWKLWNLAIEGITSFSTFPLRVWTYVGLSISCMSIGYAGWMVLNKLLWGNPVPGYPSLITATLFLSGIQIMGLGVLGEYIGRIYIETKGRPRYIVKEAHVGPQVSATAPTIPVAKPLEEA